MNKYYEELVADLEENWDECRSEGDTWESKYGGKFVNVSQEDQGARRWSATQVMVTKTPDGKFYQWEYDRGLTEMQDDDRYDNQVLEVEEYTETIVLKKYRRVS